MPRPSKSATDLKMAMAQLDRLTDENVELLKKNSLLEIRYAADQCALAEAAKAYERVSRREGEKTVEIGALRAQLIDRGKSISELKDHITILCTHRDKIEGYLRRVREDDAVRESGPTVTLGETVSRRDLVMPQSHGNGRSYGSPAMRWWEL